MCLSVCRALAGPTGARVVVCIERHNPLLCVTSPPVLLQHNEHPQDVCSLDEIHVNEERLRALVQSDVGDLDPES